MSIFKKDFYWGNSVSSMQTEGAWDQGGKGLSVYDVREATEESSDWKVATDSYHRYIEDFDLMKEMGMNCYRFQISWSRVNPTGDGEFNEEGIAFYDKFIDDLIKLRKYNLWQTIFSLRNEKTSTKSHKIICIFGIKFKIKVRNTATETIE